MLMGIIKEYERRNYFHIETFCVMPDHYHILLRILSNKSLSQIIYSINSYFAYRHRKQFGIVRIWSRNTWDVWIRSEEMYWQKVAYVLLNPWRAGLVGIPYSDYPYSDISEWRMTYGIRFLNDIFEQYSRGME
ncbi:transposase [Patescibacteria group bacterium]|nr:transposase [Patescibacteria group bacterium]